jgi:Na+/proline symporter
MVAFGMVGASISGVTFVSVPGMVLASQMTYLQVCLGFIVGYLIVAFALLPVYYKMNLTTIYTYLGNRLGNNSYKTGAWFFLLSKMVGSAVKFYVMCIILQQFVFDNMGIPFVANVVFMVMLIWLYTRRGGVRTLVFTDTFQTLCLFTALLLIIYMVMRQMDFSVVDAVRAIADDERSRIFVMDDWASPHNFWKQFMSGAFIVIVMTGLDQDMMQKNLTCRTLRDAQKDMCSYGVAFVPANMLFMGLGILLAQLFESQGIALPAKGDELLPQYITAAANYSLLTLHYSLIEVLFVLGIVAASFSSADSALTSLTTSYCVDIRQKPEDERLRKHVHLAICLLFVVFIILFRMFNNKSLIDAIYTIVSYTYGPLLGLFAFGLFTRRQVNDRWVPAVCIASPFLCYGIDMLSQMLWDYRFGYELLMLNGLLTFLGLYSLVRSAECQNPF